MRNLIHKVSHELHTLEGYASYNTVIENPSDLNNPYFYPHGSEKPYGWNQYNDIEIYAEVEDETDADFFSMVHQVYVRQL